MTKSQSQNFILFRDAARNCDKCRTLGLLYNHINNGRAFPLFDEEATCPTQIIFVAEAPNRDDTFKYGRITYDIETDPTCKFVRRLLASVGLVPSDVVFTNSVLCLPAQREGKYPVMAAQSRNCLKWLEMAIKYCNAKIVVTLGGEALKAIGRLSRHGLKLRTSAGKVRVWNNRFLLPLYHPSMLGRNARSSDKQISDIQPLKELVFGQCMCLSSP